MLRITVALATLVATVSMTGAAQANPQVQALPTPLQFARYLDLECFRTNTYQPPAVNIVTQHLNPVLAGLPVETHTLGPREKLCVPVAKNNVIPPAGVLDFVRFVDLSCYRITGTTVNYPLNLRHLNPLLANLPARNVVITAPQHLCVPVIKNNVSPSAEVLSLVRYIDLKCYGENPPAPLNIGLNLRHLNPVLGNLAPHNASVTYNRQLCVPVRKNNQAIPAATLNIIRWIDLEMFDIATPTLPTPFSLTIRHINPSLVNLPVENVLMYGGFQLGLPMAKNNQIPPG